MSGLVPGLLQLIGTSSEKTGESGREKKEEHGERGQDLFCGSKRSGSSSVGVFGCWPGIGGSIEKRSGLCMVDNDVFINSLSQSESSQAGLLTLICRRSGGRHVAASFSPACLVMPSNGRREGLGNQWESRYQGSSIPSIPDRAVRVAPNRPWPKRYPIRVA